MKKVSVPIFAAALFFTAVLSSGLTIYLRWARSPYREEQSEQAEMRWSALRAPGKEMHYHVVSAFPHPDVVISNQVNLILVVCPLLLLSIAANVVLFIKLRRSRG